MDERTDPGLRADLRLAVHRLRAGERRRRFPAAVHVGDLVGGLVDDTVGDPADDSGDDAVHWTVDPGLSDEVGLRTEIAAALLSRALLHNDPPAVWLTRVGEPWPHDLDAAWIGPLDRALAEAGVVPRCLVVVTKAGWYDPVSGQRATWQRLRIRSRPTPG